MSRPDLPYLLGLARCPAVGARTIHRLSESFPSFKEAFFSSKKDWENAGLPTKVIERFFGQREKIEPEKEIELLDKHRVKVISFLDENYPPLLRTLSDGPGILFVRGELPNRHLTHIAVVGSRRPTPYGQSCIRSLVPPLIRSGAVIVSGLAYGIDSMAHTIAINEQGQTIAVLGSGVDDRSIYPADNRGLADRIIANYGAVISELPIGTQARRHFFPFRNRIIAGLCQAVVVGEAAKKSGSLITAQEALEYGREVFAIPGRIDSPLSEGPLHLIKTGACPVTSATDILETLALPIPNKKTEFQPTTTEEKIVYDLLTDEPKHIDELAAKTEFTISCLARILSRLEMKNVIQIQSGTRYSRQP